ncbi:MAG: hypothetical protein AVDCRST_MAG68-3447, partial [uncultured Gemmatimonadetes bacterium]
DPAPSRGAAGHLPHHGARHRLRRPRRAPGRGGRGRHAPPDPRSAHGGRPGRLGAPRDGRPAGPPSARDQPVARRVAAARREGHRASHPRARPRRAQLEAPPDRGPLRDTEPRGL